MGEPTLERVFWSPVLVEDLDDGPALCAELEPLILARREAHPSLVMSNVGGWHSGHDLLDWGGPAAQRIAARASELADLHSVSTGEADRRISWRVSAWANVLSAGDYHTTHAHGGAYWSAVFFVRADPGDGGELVLHDPRRPMIEMHAPNLRFRPSGGEGAIHLKPKAGTLVMMPGWLMHSVRRWQGEGLRISAAFNLGANGPAAA